MGGRRAMSVWLAHWSIDRARRGERRRPDADRRPLVLIAEDRRRQVVTRCCEVASAGGVRPGMPVAQARALFDVGGLRVEAYDAAGDEAALRRLAVWAGRFSPIVAADGPEGLLLDVTGCRGLFGGEEAMLGAVREGLRGLGFRARAAIGPSFACAWGVARFGASAACVVGCDGAREALSPLPVAALRLDAATVARLGEVGLERVGDVLALPRSALPARFGESLLLSLDRALGEGIEPIEPVRPCPPPAAERVLEGPTDRADAVAVVVRGLLEELSAALRARSCGATRVVVTLTRSDAPPERLAVVLGRPAAEAGHLWALVRPGLERAHLGFGVEAARVEAASVARLKQAQAGCVEGVVGVPEAEAQRSLAAMLDTLVNRFGAGRVLRAGLRASHLPERACGWWQDREGAFAAGRAGTPGVEAGAVARMDRPTVLLERPEPAGVIALTPDGPVHRVRWRGAEHAVTACVGPERIGGEWWRGSDRTREYFAVRDEDGLWLWLVRGVEQGRWFVHGVWS